MERKINIIEDLEGRKIVMIHDARFKGKMKEDWSEVEDYLKEYIGEFYEIEETSEKIFISDDFPDEYANSESRIALKGAVAKAKANAAQGIPELIQIARNAEYSENTKKKHEKDTKYGWYRYDVRFAIPVHDDKTGEVLRYNIFFARMLVRHADDGNKYLYDLLAVKKEKNLCSAVAGDRSCFYSSKRMLKNVSDKVFLLNLSASTVPSPIHTV